jgi:hypothetical protein
MNTPTQQGHAGDSPPGQPKLNSRQVAGCGITICTLVVASVVAWYVQPAPTAVARKYLSDQGVATDNLELVGYRDSIAPVFPFPKEATVEFRANGADPPKKLVVELSRIVYFLPWRTTAFREKVEK